MVRLYQFRRVFGLPNASIFCMKAECWLRMAGIEYENVWVDDPSKMPKGKCPVLEHEGRQVADSTFMVEYLREHFGAELDASLDARERAVAHAFTRMVEERSYWVMVYSRWLDEAGWPLVKRYFFGKMPPVVRDLVASVMQARVRRQLHGQGIGRHGREEIFALGRRDLEAISAQLADQDFFMGPEPTAVDATVYAFVANALHSLPDPLAEAAWSHPNLAPYCERMRARYFPELHPETTGPPAGATSS